MPAPLDRHLVALLVTATATAVVALAGCQDRERSSAAGFCTTYAAHRDGPAETATAAADELAATDLPDSFGADARAGFAVHLDYLRDQGDGRDVGLFEEQYPDLFDEPGRKWLAFLDAADVTCDVGSSTEIRGGAPKQDYCEALALLFTRDGSRIRESATTLAGVGLPDRLPIGQGFTRAGLERGFSAYVVRAANASDAQARTIGAGEDDAFRHAFGVTDAPFLDAWFISSLGSCGGGN